MQHRQGSFNGGEEHEQVSVGPVTSGQRFPRSEGINGTNGCLWISPKEIFDIFEGTEQIQQLDIARAISGLRIE